MIAYFIHVVLSKYSQLIADFFLSALYNILFNVKHKAECINYRKNAKNII